MSTRLDFEQISRLAQAVAVAGLTPPPKAYRTEPRLSSSAPELDRTWVSDLSSAISWAYTLQRTYADLTSDSRSKRRLERLYDVVRLSERLRNIVLDEDMPLSSALDRHSKKQFGASATVEGLANLAEAADAEIHRLEDVGLADRAVFSKSDGEAPFAGEGAAFIGRMAQAFSKAYGVDASVHYSTAREPIGPFLTFVSGAMREVATTEAGDTPIKDTPDAISQAFKRWKQASDKVRI